MSLAVRSAKIPESILINDPTYSRYGLVTFAAIAQPSVRLQAMETFKEFTFEAAHRLLNVPAKHKCARLHGYSFAVLISVAGDVGNDTGYAMNFSDVSAASKPLPERPDPCYLNEIDGLENPTSEHLAL